MWHLRRFRRKGPDQATVVQRLEEVVDRHQQASTEVQRKSRRVESAADILVERTSQALRNAARGG